ncbi:NAD(P)-binding domain-containing protein [Desulfomicrobium escambiense]|uniref:NAD(P)-binding domain-containing protein n=1 Tax=Desulfomicrobium escambiense TaxID=29503 RepID=UPI0004103051|nr:NAD(P)-binding domain-containing protein [Desulfomicrobium escambiense]
MKETIAVIGLGYVGLPLAIEFGKKFKTIGFDLSEQKVANYTKHIDTMGEVDAAGFAAAVHFEPTTDASRLKDADFVIVAVPTPIGRNRRPDLSPVESASRIVGRNLKPGAVVVFESTVYPGVTDLIIEKFSVTGISNQTILICINVPRKNIRKYYFMLDKIACCSVWDSVMVLSCLSE